MTKNFKLSEFTVSSSYPHLVRPIPEHLIPNIRALAENVLQPLRDAIGPITVTSGYRSEELNTKVGGSKTSQHPRAEAADIKGRITPEEIAQKVVQLNLPFDQMIIYDTLLHISHKAKNRGQILR